MLTGLAFIKVTTLGYKSIDYPIEIKTIVKTFCDQGFELCNMHGRHKRSKLDNDQSSFKL
jgi:hypothetical protein